MKKLLKKLTDYEKDQYHKENMIAANLVLVNTKKCLNHIMN